MDHFRNPKNYGSIENADGVGEVGNPVCGDMMKIYIKVGKDKGEQEFIKDIKFETFGCVAAIATSSVTTELVKGKSLKEAEKISKKEIVDALKGLPPIKVHCSLLASQALKKAIEDYRTKNR